MTQGTDATDGPRYRDAADRPPEGVVSVGADLVVSACDPTAAALLGTREDALVGASVWEVFSDARGTVAEARIDEALSSRRRRAFEWYEPGARAWFEVRVYPADGGLSLVVRELGERGRDRSAGRAAGPVGVGGWRIDLPSRTLHVSDEVRRIRGLPPDYDLTLAEGIEFYHPEDRPTIREAVDRLEREGETYDLELREVGPDGEVYWVRTTGVPEYGEDGDIVALRGVYRDITARRERERERARRADEMAHQNERLDRFASVLSHDLRSPLTAAQGYLELARERSENEHHDRIGDALARMESLIEDVLDLARNGEEVDDPAPCVLADVAARCWDESAGRDASLVVETDATILADPGRLCRLFENLFRNAVEHGGDDVTVTVGDLDDGFYVEDDGPGIPAEDREAVFEFGYTTDARGTGFGLAIVREIAGAHRWRVGLADADGGARFEIRGVERAPQDGS